MKFGETIPTPAEERREEPKKETKKIIETQLRLPKTARDYIKK